jgi:CP family cyanate transporter-like MFS transporter
VTTDRLAHSSAKPRQEAGRQWIALILLWLCGNALRLTILALPPVIASIRDEFGLNATQVGLLGSIAPALFAIAALAGSLIVARIGVRAALLSGLALVAVGSAMRGLAADYALLLLTTTLMCVGVAIMQPVMPTAVREWLPGRIALATAVYTNGLLAGEVFPVLLTTPVVLPLVGGSWRASLAAWSIVVAAIAAMVWTLAPRTAPGLRLADQRPQRWIPDWRSGLVWRLGVLFGCINTIYFSANTFIPIYLASAGRADLISGALTALNFGQLPASALLLMVARRLEGRVWPYLASGLLSLLSLAGLVLQVGAVTVMWAAMLGFSDAAALILGLTLPATLCRSEDVARTAAGAFTISYGSALVLAIASGVLWDLSGIAWLAFLPLALCAAGLVLIPARMRAQNELR